MASRGGDSSPIISAPKSRRPITPNDLNLCMSPLVKSISIDDGDNSEEDVVSVSTNEEKESPETEPLSEAPTTVATAENETYQGERKSYKKLWFLHGKYYDLEPFIESHPGGRAILRMSQGVEDATPLMESYHAFANKAYIAATLAKYEVPYKPIGAEERRTTQTSYTFEPNGFYNTLIRRVRAHFGSTKPNESISNRVKANRWWVFKVFLQTIVLLTSYATAFVLPVESFYVQAGAAVLSAITIVALGMVAMHDGSHFAIGARDSWKNKFAMRLWNSVSLWDPAKWMYHHTVLHHSFTGDSELDPDTMHAKPFVRKTLLANRNKYLRLPVVLAAERWFWAFYAMMIYVFSPGMYVGQVISYRIIWPLKGRLWKMSSVPEGAFKKYLWEDVLTLCMLGAQVYRASPLLTLIFFTACNAIYAMCIIPDHDTFESAVENHVSGGKVDWGEIQVRHSADFAGTNFIGRFLTEMFGGIQLQIGHHLMPGVNHVYLRELVPIIKETCKEFNIPYADQGSLPTALWSFVKTVHTCMGIDDANEAKVNKAKVNKAKVNKAE